jgi:hypothetical protein
MITGVWYYLASPIASLVIAVVMLSILIRLGYHRDPNNALARRRLATVVTLSAAAYTFIVLATSELIFHGPHLSVLASEGFGNVRIAWLLLAVVIDICFSIWDEFRKL